MQTSYYRYIFLFLAPRNQGYQPCLDSVQKSLQHLKTDYLDLYLIHWPGVSGKKVDDVQNSKLREGSWKALEHCYSSGTLKAIGVSNYTIQHLEEMKKYAETMPHVLQVIQNVCWNVLFCMLSFSFLLGGTSSSL